MSEQINVIAAMTLAAQLLDAHHPGHKSPAAAKLDEARVAVAALISAARTTLYAETYSDMGKADAALRSILARIGETK